MITVLSTTGASPGFGRGGGQEISFSDLGICMSRSDMLRMAKPCAMLGGFGGMLPRENFLKRCNLVRIRVYFDQILSLFFSKNAIFSSFFFFRKKLPIVVVRDVCPSVRLSSVEIISFRGNSLPNRPIELKIGLNVREGVVHVRKV